MKKLLSFVALSAITLSGAAALPEGAVPFSRMDALNPNKTFESTLGFSMTSGTADMTPAKCAIAIPTYENFQNMEIIGMKIYGAKAEKFSKELTAWVSSANGALPQETPDLATAKFTVNAAGEGDVLFATPVKITGEQVFVGVDIPKTEATQSLIPTWAKRWAGEHIIYYYYTGSNWASVLTGNSVWRAGTGVPIVVYLRPTTDAKLASISLNPINLGAYGGQQKYHHMGMLVQTQSDEGYPGLKNLIGAKIVGIRVGGLNHTATKSQFKIWAVGADQGETILPNFSDEIEYVDATLTKYDGEDIEYQELRYPDDYAKELGEQYAYRDGLYNLEGRFAKPIDIDENTSFVAGCSYYANDPKSGYVDMQTWNVPGQKGYYRMISDSTKPVSDVSWGDTSSDSWATTDEVAYPIYLMIEKGDAPTSVSGVAAENSVTEYYDLMGRRIAMPETGIFIMRQGSKVTKIAR